MTSIGTLFAFICVCMELSAVGSGIPEVKAFLNGVNLNNGFGDLVEKIQKLMAERKQIYDQVHDLRQRLKTS